MDSSKKGKAAGGSGYIPNNSCAAILKPKINLVNDFDAEKLLMLISGDIATLHLALICLSHGNILPKRDIYLAVKSIAAAFKNCEANNVR